ncbi:unnamed protein product [Lactuca saligna]|uniref:Uncharacterized protein n=1 Tax=Lactuca saligna TaxID=75948 RepID=A0AA36E0N3_LACSI|nr:unnamed protein product [Lactuca saligna]
MIQRLGTIESDVADIKHILKNDDTKKRMTDDDVYFMDLSFIDAKPLQTVFPYSYDDAEGEKLPQGEPNDVESDEDNVLLRRKQKVKASSVVGFSKKEMQGSYSD